MASDISPIEPAPPTDKPADKKDYLASLCGQVLHLPAGDRAALRRLFLTRSEEAVGVVVGLLIRAGVPDAQWHGQHAFARWQLLAHVAAVLSGTAAVPPHQPGSSLGRALSGAGYSELRLMRLTSARGSALVDQIVRATRFLGAAGKAPVNLHTLHSLSFDTGQWAEQARLRIARDYYAADHANTKDAS